ncbi:hypothetical protein PROFUN_16685 [Planoprotostelium fungivorum]|uniref:Uncharacterized protein n=1 Tax=Planoprotostelium fungivorum TaxID=1890364 RepID=A0A2P6MPS4_9EUKA|nr:hypothetical protein PROFUN_16685 [Planoprotostelium fungivorum]
MVREGSYIETDAHRSTCLRCVEEEKECVTSGQKRRKYVLDSHTSKFKTCNAAGGDPFSRYFCTLGVMADVIREENQTTPSIGRAQVTADRRHWHISSNPLRETINASTGALPRI